MSYKILRSHKDYEHCEENIMIFKNHINKTVLGFQVRAQPFLESSKGLSSTVLSQLSGL